MDSRPPFPHDLLVLNDCNEHIEYQLVLEPASAHPWNGEQIHPCRWLRIFLPSQNGHSTDDRIVNLDLLVELATFASGSDHAMATSNGPDGALVDTGYWQLVEAAYVALVEVVDTDMDDDSHDDCSMELLLHGRHSVHGSNSVHEGILEGVDHLIPIGSVAEGGDAELEV